MKKLNRWCWIEFISVLILASRQNSGFKLRTTSASRPATQHSPVKWKKDRWLTHDAPLLFICSTQWQCLSHHLRKQTPVTSSNLSHVHQVNNTPTHNTVTHAVIIITQLVIYESWPRRATQLVARTWATPWQIVPPTDRFTTGLKRLERVVMSWKSQ